MAVPQNALNRATGKGSEDPPSPPRPSAVSLETVKDKYRAANQEQVFAFYDELDGEEKAALLSQLSSFDPHYINTITDRALNPSKVIESERELLEPLPKWATESVEEMEECAIKEWTDEGLYAIAMSKVAVVLMAGGQGTRLGSTAPKGCYDIGLPSSKSLFQLQAERILKIQELALKRVRVVMKDPVVPWYIMTSGPTRGPTEKFFEEHEYFGLKKENVIIFEQGVLPCISNDGKILLESRGKVAVAPDGNGGIYQALVTSNILSDMRKRDVEHIHAYCVDNCLVKVADPVFIGWARRRTVHIATKVVRKRSAREMVGLIVLKNGKPGVVEYSEIDSATAKAKDPEQHDLLKFRAANIVNHYYSIKFLETIPQWAHQLPHHVARKKIPYVDTDTGTMIKPEKPNGIKLEQFVFDCFPMVEIKRFAALEVRREDEFSPLKNARGTGEDDPDTSKKDIMDQGRRWLQRAGAIILNEGEEESGVEVSPLISYAGEGLEKTKEQTILAPAILEKDTF